LKLIKFTYKTKTLSQYGFFLLVAMLVLLLFGWFFIPSIPEGMIDQQPLSLNGKYLKFNDMAIVSGFIESIKKNNGYLVLGTSETTSIKKGNFYDFLNADTSVRARFSVLAGAGRTCGIHIPMLMSHKESVDSLKIIYMINPVYWRSELCRINKGYWVNYNNYAMCKQLDLTDNEHRKYYGVIEPYFQVLNIGEKMIYTIEYWLRRIRSKFFQDLKYYLDPNEYVHKMNFFNPKKSGLGLYENYNRPDLELIDTSWNISYKFHDKKWLNPILEEETYRFDELKSFISITQDLGIDVIYIVGPYNQTFIEKYNPALLEGYSNTVDKIKVLLKNENVKFIDASGIAKMKGSFRDNQHHSSFGAYLIYEKIKSFINENN